MTQSFFEKNPDFPQNLELLELVISHGANNYKSYVKNKKDFERFVYAGKISIIEVFQAALHDFDKNNNIELIDYLLKNNPNYALDLTLNDYAQVRCMIMDDNEKSIEYYLQNGSLIPNEHFKEFYNYFKSSEFFTKNNTTQLLEVYMLDFSLEDKPAGKRVKL